MTYQGKVQDGVVVFINGAALPEGTQVTIVPLPGETDEKNRERLKALEELAAQAQELDMGY
ncbi:MAG TPA: hypothetical protein VJ783_30845 [Pirellulales bacterium]|nr:hypothetical protein [Pirellulales bacterium]